MGLSRFGVLVLVFSLWCPISSFHFRGAFDEFVGSTELLQISAQPMSKRQALEGDCHDVQEKDKEHSRCWKAMKWAKTVNILTHPSYYRPLSRDSPIASFQPYISFCPKLCDGQPNGELINPPDQAETEDSVLEAPEYSELNDDVPEAPKSSEMKDDVPTAPDYSEMQDVAPEAPKYSEMQDDVPTAPEYSEMQDDAPETAPKYSEMQDDAPETPENSETQDDALEASEPAKTDDALEASEPAKTEEDLLASAPSWPQSPGCYARNPFGCPRQAARLGKNAYSKWRGDEKGKESASACKERAAALDLWCGSTGMVTVFRSPNPTKPGCYAWRPLGCPLQQIDRYDVWHAELKGSEGFGACKARAAPLDHWCGSPGTQTFFVPKEGEQKQAKMVVTFPDLLASAPVIPKTPGCYAWIPAGCPSHEAELEEGAFSSKWRGDERGRESASACKARAAALDHWCGTSEAQTTFVTADPTAPGCYAWRPLGCPRQQTDRYDEWVPERQGREGYGACKAREVALDKWCGSPGTRMKFIPGKAGDLKAGSVYDPSREHVTFPDLLASAPEIPKNPGCYVWMPSGCPSQAARLGDDAYAKWRGDEKGSESSKACKARAATLGRWCGSSDAQTTFVTLTPTKPGCYVWRPLGCPRQQVARYDTWREEPKGSESFEACKEREAEINTWCGSPESRLRFVPGGAADPETPDPETPVQAETRGVYSD